MNKPLTKDNPARAERDVTIVQSRLKGHTYAELSKEFNLSKTSISRILNDSEVKEIIEQGQRNQVALIPLADQAIFDSVTQEEDKRLRFDAAKVIHANTGIAPTHTNTTFIQNIFNDNRRLTLSEGMRPLIEGSQADQKAIEGDFEVIDAAE